MWDQLKHNNLDQKALKQFILLLKTVEDSPSLIQRIAENREFFFFCAVIINQDRDIRFHLFEQALKNEAKRQCIAYDKIIDKLIPIATVLGIHALNSNSIQSDYYQRLGVSPKSSVAAIKKAYRSKARETHPDTQKGESEKFVSISEAYNVLSDKTKRNQYDRSRKKTTTWSWSEKPDEELRDKTKSVLSRNYIFSFIVIILVLITVSLIVDHMNHELSLNSDEFNISVKKKLPAANDSQGSENITNEPSKVHRIQSMKMISSEESKSRKSISLIPNNAQIGDFASKKVHPETSLSTDGDEFIEKNKLTQITIIPKVNKRYLELIKKPGIPDQKQKTTYSETKKSIDENQKVLVPKIKKSVDIVQKEIKPATESTALSAGEKASVNIGDHIKAFLNHYSKTYEDKKLDEFMKLFTVNAKENGKPVKNLMPLYQRNFELLDSIKYTIDLKNYSWDLARGKIHLKGTFKLSWRKKPDKQAHNYHGSINLLLVPHAEHSFQVEKLSYRFDN